jgi:hypothetical protein
MIGLGQQDIASFRDERLPKRCLRRVATEAQLACVFLHNSVVLRAKASRAHGAQRSAGGSQNHPPSSSPTTSDFPAAAHAAVRRQIQAARFS